MNNIKHAIAGLALLGLAGCGCGNTGTLWQFASGVDVPSCGASYLVQDFTSEFYELDLLTGAFVVRPDDYDLDLNAIGYNIKDHKIYGIAYEENLLDTTTYAVAIADPNTSPIHVEIVYVPIPVDLQGEVEQAPHTGDVDANGYLHMSKRAATGIIVIDVDPTRSTYMQLIRWRTFKGDYPTLPSADWAFSPVDHQLYCLDYVARDPVTGQRINKLVRVNPRTGFIEDLGVTTIPGGRGFGAAYASKGGIIYFSDNTSGEVWSVDVSDPDNPSLDATLVSVGPGNISRNDGARCALAP